MLSSDIQRMKRMDTLKRHKLKKRELENDKRGENFDNKSADLINELKQTHCFRLISARQLDENCHNSDKILVQEISPEGNNQIHYSSGLLELEEEEEGEEEEEQDGDEHDDDGDDNEEHEENNLDEAKFAKVNKMQSQKEQHIKALNYSALPKDIQSRRERQINLDKESSKIAAGDISKFDNVETPARASSKIGVDAAPSRGEDTKQQENVSNYIDSNIRHNCSKNK